MSNIPTDVPVVDDTAGHRFISDQDGATAELRYRTEVRLVLMRTNVSLSLKGRGISGELVRFAAARARAENLTLVPLCPYARRWLRDHPEVSEGLTIDWTVNGAVGRRPS